MVGDELPRPPEMADLENAGWKFVPHRGWYLPKAFMEPWCFDDAIKLNKAIQKWSKS